MIYTHVYIDFYYKSVCNSEMSDVMFDAQFHYVSGFFSMHMYSLFLCFQLVLLIGVTILLASSYVTLTGPERVERHDSVVKLGQPIQHHEDDLAIHDDEELKKKLNEMNDQRPGQEKVDYVEPGHEMLKAPRN